MFLRVAGIPPAVENRRLTAVDIAVDIAARTVVDTVVEIAVVALYQVVTGVLGEADPAAFVGN